MYKSAYYDILYKKKIKEREKKRKTKNRKIKNFYSDLWYKDQCKNNILINFYIAIIHFSR